MSYKKLIFNGIISLSAAVLLSACGGGSSSNPATTANASATTGAITAFGSVYVNGREIQTDKATIYMEGKSAKESDLRVGMVVTLVEGSTGSASCINYDDDLEGIVISNSITTGTTTGSMNIMGQTVNIDENTIFESYVTGINTFSDIVADNIVEVSGYSAGTGDVSATRVEVKAADLASYSENYVELKGVVRNHNANTKTFDIGTGTLTVDHTGVTPDGMTAITDGMYVEVKSTQGIVGGNLIASKVELEDGGMCKTESDEDDEFEVHGKVVAVTDTSLTVDSYTFIIDDNTRYEHSNKAGVVVGAMIEVEGTYNADNLLVAKEIEVDDNSSNKVVAYTGSIQAVTNTSANVGVITIGTQEFIVNGDTIMHDSSTTDMKRFNITFLTQGNTVEIYAYDNGTSKIATKVVRK